MKVTSFPSETTPFRVQLPGRYSPDGKRKTRYFASRPEAEKFLKSVKKLGLAAPDLNNKPIALTPNEHDRLKVTIDHVLEKLGTSDPAALYAAVEHYQKTRLNAKPGTTRDAVEAFHTYRQTYRGNKNKPLRPRTLETDNWCLNQLIRHDAFEKIQLAEITPLMFREFFATMSPGTMLSVFKKTKKFIRWAIRYGYLAVDPLAGIDQKSEIGEFGVNNEFYPVKTFRRMLRIAAGLEPVKEGGEVTKEFADLLPVFVLGGFAGLRSCESTQRVKGSEAVCWSDLHFDADIPCLEVRDEVAKQSSGVEQHVRHIDSKHAIEALKAWLPLIPETSHFIVGLGSRTIHNLKSKFTKATGIKFLENGLRNSFATYALSYDGLAGLGGVARQMGNAESICSKHYAQRLPSGSGKAWFDLRPFETVVDKQAAA